MTKTDIPIHPLQVEVLRVLIFTEAARFSELNATKAPNDQFAFHLRQLLTTGLVEKLENGKYRLTASGKEFANRFDMDTPEKIAVERQAKLGVLVVCIDDSPAHGGERRYLVQQRLKQPYYGFHGFITGKVKWGETIAKTAARELGEEAGCAADLTFFGLQHKMDYAETGELLEDKFFFMFKAERLRGALVEQFEGGRNVWLSRKELEAIPEVFNDVPEVMNVIERGDAFAFLEHKYTVARY